MLGRIVTARRTGGAARDAWAHPLSIVLLAVLTVRSHAGHARGTLQWKGRRLPS